MINLNAPFLMPDGRTITKDWARYLTSLAQNTNVVASFNGRAGVVNLAKSDVTTALGFTPPNQNNAALTGTPTAPTQAAGDNTQAIATDAFVQGAVNGMTSVNVAGGANVTLSAVEAGAGILVFTGSLTANIAVIVPGATGKWQVSNQTTGAYSLTVKTSTGTGISVVQGSTAILWCDGTNVNAGVSVGPWQSPTLLNGWVSYGTPYAPPSYCVDNLGIVRLRGVVKSGTVGTATPVFKLPSGYIPPYEALFAIQSNNTIGQLLVDASGNVMVGVGSNASVSLDGVTFRNV